MGRFFRWMMSLFQKKALKENRDYEVYPGENFTGVRILRGKYKGVIYQYDSVSIKETHWEIPVLSFHYTIHESGKFDKQELQDNNEFHTMIGDIVVDLMTNNSVEREINESNRTDYPEELGI